MIEKMHERPLATLMLYFKAVLQYNYYMLKIARVCEGGVGWEIGLESGDVILDFGGGYDADILEYLYFDAAEKFSLTVRKADGRVEEHDIEKYPDERLGLDFDESAEIVPRRCQNRCVFCFIDQLPKNLRESLYVKDDDFRLSLVTGNYITLTNLSEADINRIIERRFSPLYISVHAADPEVRRRMMGSRRAGGAMELIGKFSSHGIQMHCQVVLCPGINDGKVLEDTLEKLYGFYPNVKSVAVVPVGLTKHRQGLPQIPPVGKKEALAAIGICQRYPGFCYCSDEMYLKAGIALLPYERYGEFEQIENGVGLIRKFEREFEQVLSKARPRQREVVVVTGKSSFNFIRFLVERYQTINYLPSVEVAAVENNFFGDSVTVTGLITAGDIISALGERAKGKEVLIPRSMLRQFENVFLDGVSVADLEKRLGADVKVCEANGYSFFDALTGEV